MKHDELLVKINNFIYSTNRLEDASQECDCADCKLQKSLNDALLAVVELHKPIFHPDIKGIERCSSMCDVAGQYVNYPCPTIQAIEKELQ